MGVVLEDLQTQVGDLKENAAFVHPQGVSEHRHAFVVDIEVQLFLGGFWGTWLGAGLLLVEWLVVHEVKKTSLEDELVLQVKQLAGYVSNNVQDVVNDMDV